MINRRLDLVDASLSAVFLIGMIISFAKDSLLGIVIFAALAIVCSCRIAWRHLRARASGTAV